MFVVLTLYSWHWSNTCLLHILVLRRVLATSQKPRSSLDQARRVSASATCLLRRPAIRCLPLLARMECFPRRPLDRPNAGRHTFWHRVRPHLHGAPQLRHRRLCHLRRKRHVCDQLLSECVRCHLASRGPPDVSKAGDTLGQQSPGLPELRNDSHTVRIHQVRRPDTCKQ